MVVRHTGGVGNVARMTTRRSPRRALRVAALACATGLVAVACGGGSDAESSADPAPAVSSADGDAADTDATSGETNGDVPGILQFSGALVGGGELDAATLAGKPTAFWFWAPT